MEPVMFMANPAPFTLSDKSGWPTWAKVVASAAIVWLFGSLVTAELVSGPASPLERRVASVFERHYELTDQGVGHRFYSDIGPTPILWAELKFGDGRPSRTIRIPARSARPRMRYQRQLALANWVFTEVRPKIDAPDTPIESVWAQSFAHYLGRREPGCSSVAIRVQLHHNPSPARLLAAARGDGPPVDPDSDEFFDPAIFVGDYPCPTP